MPLPPTPPPPRRPSRPISRVSGRAPPPSRREGEGLEEGGASPLATPPWGPSPSLGSFEIVRSLGRGSRGEVLEVRLRSDGSRFALKRSLRPLSGPTQRRHWLRECHAQRGAGPAPGLLPLLAAWEQRGHFHLLTPLCPAGSLGHLWRKGAQRGGASPGRGVASVWRGVASFFGGVASMLWRAVLVLWRKMGKRGVASSPGGVASVIVTSTPPDASSALANELKGGVATSRDLSPLSEGTQVGVAEHKELSPLANRKMKAKPKMGVAKPKSGVAEPWVVSTPSPATSGLSPAASTPSPAMSGPSPAISGPCLVSSPSPAMSGPSPAISGPCLVSSPSPAMSGPSPAISGPCPVSGPSPAAPAPCPAGRPVSEWRLRGYLWELLLTLRHLHALPLTHGDLKPDNVLLDASGRCRLADFGQSSAPFLEGEGLGGGGGGDARYLPPEGLQEGGEGRPAGDIFSLALTVAELAGQWRLPGMGEGWRSIRSGGGGRLPPGLGEGLSPEFQAVLAAMLDPDPKLRPSAAELLSWEVLRGAGRWRPLTRLADVALRRLEDWVEAVPALCSSLRSRFWGPRTPPRPPRPDPWRLHEEEEEEEGAPERGEGSRSPSPTPDPRRTLTFEDDDDDPQPLPPPSLSPSPTH